METVADFILLGSKNTVDNDWSHKIKRCLLLWRKAVINLDSMLKNRDISLQTKISMVKAKVLPVVTYRCESWTIKKSECWRTDAFESWCWRRLLRVPSIARRSKQSIHWVYWCLKLKLQYFDYLMQRADSLEKTLRKIEGRRRRGW